MASLDAPGLLGAWRFAGDDRPHSYFFGVEGGRVVAMLTWRVDGDVLLVDQPSRAAGDELHAAARRRDGVPVRRPAVHSSTTAAPTGIDA